VQQKKKPTRKKACKGPTLEPNPEDGAPKTSPFHVRPIALRAWGSSLQAIVAARASSLPSPGRTYNPVRLGGLVAA
jgi:hypothetical protein